MPYRTPDGLLYNDDDVRLNEDGSIYKDTMGYKRVRNDHGGEDAVRGRVIRAHKATDNSGPGGESMDAFLSRAGIGSLTGPVGTFHDIVNGRPAPLGTARQMYYQPRVSSGIARIGNDYRTDRSVVEHTGRESIYTPPAGWTWEPRADGGHTLRKDDGTQVIGYKPGEIPKVGATTKVSGPGILIVDSTVDGVEHHVDTRGASGAGAGAGDDATTVIGGDRVEGSTFKDNLYRSYNFQGKTIRGPLAVGGGSAYGPDATAVGGGSAYGPRAAAYGGGHARIDFTDGEGDSFSVKGSQAYAKLGHVKSISQAGIKMPDATAPAATAPTRVPASGAGAGAGGAPAGVVLPRTHDCKGYNGYEIKFMGANIFDGVSEKNKTDIITEIEQVLEDLHKSRVPRFGSQTGVPFTHIKPDGLLKGHIETKKTGRDFTLGSTPHHNIIRYYIDMILDFNEVGKSTYQAIFINPREKEIMIYSFSVDNDIETMLKPAPCAKLRVLSPGKLFDAASGDRISYQLALSVELQKFLDGALGEDTAVFDDETSSVVVGSPSTEVVKRMRILEALEREAKMRISSEPAPAPAPAPASAAMPSGFRGAYISEAGSFVCAGEPGEPPYRVVGSEKVYPRSTCAVRDDASLEEHEYVEIYRLTGRNLREDDLCPGSSVLYDRGLLYAKNCHGREIKVSNAIGASVSTAPRASGGTRHDVRSTGGMAIGSVGSVGTTTSLPTPSAPFHRAQRAATRVAGREFTQPGDAMTY